MSLHVRVAYPAPEQVTTVGIVGAGSVGASWVALFLAHGLNVVIHDPAAGSADRAKEFIRNAWPALMDLLGDPGRPLPQSRLRFVDSVEAVTEEADVLQENVPEVLGVKTRVLSILDRHSPPERIILSSTGGIPPTALQEALERPERFVVLHPFNPTHLIPLVEIVGGRHTAPAVLDWAVAFARRLGKHPIRLNRESPGHMANRLQFALLREAVHCLVEGIASAEDIDAAVRYGLGPRWALMGSLLTLHLAGGPGGMKGILDHAGNAIESWWSALGQPQLDAEVREKLVAAADEVALGHDIADWVQWRDNNLARLLKLQQQDPNPTGPTEE